MNASFLWGDDQFMGLTLMARLAAVTMNKTLINTAVKQAINFAKYMREPADGLYSHGYNLADNRRSCCKWGRANGWGMLSHVELLKSVEAFQDLRNTSAYQQLLGLFQDHSRAVAAVQAPDGRWHQVLNESSTFLETSASAMFLSSLARGVRYHWLDAERYLPVLRRAWVGLNKAVKDDGTVTGACIGTGILTSVEAYNERPTPYLTPLDSGLGAVLYAGVDYAKTELHGTARLTEYNSFDRN